MSIPKKQKRYEIHNVMKFITHLLTKPLFFCIIITVMIQRIYTNAFNLRINGGNKCKI
jgi:hypothetical protein